MIKYIGRSFAIVRPTETFPHPFEVEEVGHFAVRIREDRPDTTVKRVVARVELETAIDQREVQVLP